MHRLPLLCVAVVALLAAACSDNSVTAERSLAAPTAVAAADIDGQMTDGFAPNVDDRVAVVGVAIGGNLAVRALPGVDQPVVARIPPTETELYGFGQTFETDDDRTWWLVRWQDSQGWIEPGAAYLGASTDVGVQVAGLLPSSLFESPGELADVVLEQYPENPIIVEQLIDSEAGTAVTTVDFIAPDETTMGERLVISATADGEQWRLSAAEEIALCRRGVDSTGGCT